MSFRQDGLCVKLDVATVTIISRKKPTTRIVRQRLGLASIGREGHARFEEDDQRDVVARQATFPENSSGSLPLAVTFQRNRPWNRESDQIRRFISGILRQPS